MGHRITAAIAAALFSCSVARGQEQLLPVTARPVERFAVGAVGAAGLPGNVAAVRVGGPVSHRLALDVTIGHVAARGRDGDGANGFAVGAQVRWLWHGRDAKGCSGYWLAGPQVLQSTNRTEVRWPNHTSTYIVDKSPFVSLQVGYGWDVMMKNGARAGVEISTGASSQGPSPFINAFVVWGPSRR